MKNCKYFTLTLLWRTVKPDWVDSFSTGLRYSYIRSLVSIQTAILCKWRLLLRHNDLILAYLKWLHAWQRKHKVVSVNLSCAR